MTKNADNLDRQAYEERLGEMRQALRDHHAGVRPDAQFSARVLEELRPHGVRDANATTFLDDLGWAALRLLPAALVLTVLVLWTVFQPRYGYATLLFPDAGDGALTAFVVSGLDEGSTEEAGVAP